MKTYAVAVLLYKQIKNGFNYKQQVFVVEAENEQEVRTEISLKAMQDYPHLNLTEVTIVEINDAKH